ncbi:MAG: hypothetical protein VR65_27285 [Desulfobulbaceae bacterium BRH_c16a]|nr:MAG: hypothetical protein VR65_27285 [Desulfobulbaceae bacterium BRH_c16a]
MKKSTALFAFTIFLILPNSLKAEDLQHNKEALIIIGDFADRLCEAVPVKGNSSSMELNSSAKGELKSLLSKILDLGFESAGKYQNSEYEGVLQADLASARKNTMECKLRVLDVLAETLLNSNSTVVNASLPIASAQTVKASHGTSSNQSTIPNAPPSSSPNINTRKASQANQYISVNLMASDWERPYVHPTADAEVDLSSKSLHINIDDPGNAFYYIQAFSYGHTLEPNQIYQVSLSAQSNKACDVRAKFHLFRDASSDRNAQSPEYCEFSLKPGNNELLQKFTSLDIQKKIRFTIYFGDCDPGSEITIKRIELAKISN